MAQFHLCTVSDVARFGIDPARVNDLIEEASEIMETDAEFGMNRLVEKQTFTDELATEVGRFRIYVKNPPAWSVSKLEFYDGSNWTEVTDDYTIKTDQATAGLDSVGEVMLEGGYAFPRGREYVRLTYVGGMATDTELLPKRLRLATAHLVSGLWQFEKRKGSAFSTRTIPETGETIGFYESLFTPFIKKRISGYRIGGL